MKSISYNRPGASSVLTLDEVQAADPGPGEVRVRIVVSGVNPTDWKARAGSSSSSFERRVPNQDGAGIVDALGSGVSGLSVGDRVWVWDAAYERTAGTAQELAVVPVRQVVPLPSNASFDVGASLGIPALTAHRTLTANEHGPARLAPGALGGQVILVTGGAGAVGHAAIQLARWAGATVITTVSGPEKAELARAAGAHHVINYRNEDVAAAVLSIAEEGVDTIVDVNVQANGATDLAVLKFGGTIAIYASDSSAPLAVPIGSAMRRNARYQFVLTYTVTEDQKTNAVTAVTSALADGALPVGAEHGLPLTRFDLADTAAAHDAVEADTVGKVLIDVTDA
ncbi:NADPH:quinone reductase [Microbacterium sp. NPDC055910]|mgnify:CR=1 FL=1|jgi:NADPH2:quinone reductase|uniref:NADPH:quinone reductase n=1 Tax=Microbacterium sp. NPDC055910 TaxID=3345659 RepID=UPI0035D8E2F2